MLYIMDTANLDKIRHCVKYYPIDGVTTNPSIISKEHSDFPKLIKEIRSIIGEERMFHIQVTGDSYEEIVREATDLPGLCGRKPLYKGSHLQRGT